MKNLPNPLLDFLAAFVVIILVLGPLLACFVIDPLFIFGYFLTAPIGWVLLNYKPKKK
jgi:hypothetical protein